MAVKLPTLSRIETGSALPSNNRIKVKATNNASSILSRTQGLTSTIQAGVNLGKSIENDKRKADAKALKEAEAAAKVEAKIIEDAENKKITTLTQDAQFKSKEWSENKLRDLKASGEDPTKSYASYDKESDDNALEIQKGYENASPRVKEAVNRNLEVSRRNQGLSVDKQRGAQQETYDYSLHTATVKSQSESVTTAMGNVNQDNQDSYLHVDNAMNDINSTIAQRAVESGAGQQVESGGTVTFRNDRGEIVSVKLNAHDKLQLAKTKSTALSTAINNQLATGDVAGAKNSLEKYGKQIDGKSRTAILNKFKTADTKASAGDFLGKLDGKTETQKKIAVDGIKDPVLQKEVLKLQNDLTRQRNFQRDQKDKVNTEQMSGFVEKQMSNGEFTMSQFEETQAYKLGWDNLGAKGKRAVKEMIDAPRDSSSTSLDSVSDAFLDTDKMNAMVKMSPSEFNRNYLAGLNESDKKLYTKRYEQLKDPSAASLRASNVHAGKRIKERLIREEFVSLSSKNKLDKSERALVGLAKKAYMDYVDSVGGREIKPQETEEVITKVLANAIKTKSGFFGGGGVTGFKPLTTKELKRGKTPKSGASSTELLGTRQERKELRRQFKEANDGRRAKTMEELLEFKNSQGNVNVTSN